MNVCNNIKFAVIYWIKSLLVKYSHNVYLDSDSCQQQRNTAKNCLKQLPQEEKNEKAQGPFRVEGHVALDTPQQAAPAVPTAMGRAARLDIMRDCNSAVQGRGWDCLSRRFVLLKLE